jgi:hypothetical protein
MTGLSMPHVFNTLTKVSMLAMLTCYPAIALATTKPSAVFRQSLVEAYRQSDVTPQVSEYAIPEASARAMVSRRIAKSLLLRVRRVSGQTYRVAPAKDQMDRTAGILVLEYRNAGTAQRMLGTAKRFCCTFRNAIILTGYSVTALDKLLIITFSESAGDAGMITFLNKMPAKFKAERVAPGDWRE